MKLSFYNSLKKLKGPVKEIKANEQYVVFTIPYKLAYYIGVSWIDRRLMAIGLRPYKCRQMNGGVNSWGEELERRRGYKRLFFTSTFSRLRAVGLLRRLKSAKYVRFKSSK
jgi:hypothetical protein